MFMACFLRQCEFSKSELKQTSALNIKHCYRLQRTKRFFAKLYQQFYRYLSFPFYPHTPAIHHSNSKMSIIAFHMPDLKANLWSNSKARKGFFLQTGDLHHLHNSMNGRFRFCLCTQAGASGYQELNASSSISII